LREDTAASFTLLHFFFVSFLFVLLIAGQTCIAYMGTASRERDLTTRLYTWVASEHLWRSLSYSFILHHSMV
jgi:hypothetical protein